MFCTKNKCSTTLLCIHVCTVYIYSVMFHTFAVFVSSRNSNASNIHLAKRPPLSLLFKTASFVAKTSLPCLDDCNKRYKASLLCRITFFNMPFSSARTLIDFSIFIAVVLKGKYFLAIVCFDNCTAKWFKHVVICFKLNVIAPVFDSQTMANAAKMHERVKLWLDNRYKQVINFICLNYSRCNCKESQLQN